MNKRVLIFCSICIFILVFSFGESQLDAKEFSTAWHPERPSSQLSSVREFFERPLEQIKEDISAYSGDINTFCLEQFQTTPILCYAAMDGTPEILEFLLEKGADTEFINKFSNSTALYDAVSTCRLDSAKILLKYGANPNYMYVDKPIDRGVDGYTSVLLQEKLLQKHQKKNKITGKEDNEKLYKSKQTFAEIIKLLLPITKLEENAFSKWEKKFYSELSPGVHGAKFTNSEIEKEWKIFLSLIQ